MPKSKTVGPNDVFSPATAAKIAADRANVTEHQAGDQSRDQKSATDLYNVFSQFLGWDHGYLKVRSESDGRKVHYVWTWTLGPHHGSYVYVAVPQWDALEGLTVLARKVFEVDEGLRKPTPDRRNSQYKPTANPVR